MFLIKQFTIGDRIPEDAKMLGMQTFVDFKARERNVHFYLAVPEDRRRRKRPKAPKLS